MNFLFWQYAFPIKRSFCQIMWDTDVWYGADPTKNPFNQVNK